MCEYVIHFIGRHPGLLMVLTGVGIGEAAEWKEMTGPRGKTKRWSAILLVLGLIVEFGEAAKSDKDVADTREQTAAIMQTNLVLQTKLVELQASIEPRRIKQAQMADFAFLASRVQKIPVKIMVVNSQEPLTYAHDLREMFTTAGFGTNDDVDVFGINRTDASMVRLPGQTNKSANLVFMMGTSIISNNFRFESTNGFTRPIIAETNETVVYPAIKFCMDQLKIPNRLQEATNFVAKDQMLIFVGEKE